MEILSFLKDINKFKFEITSNENGIEFEKDIMNYLIKNNSYRPFSADIFKNDKKFKEIKNLILNYNCKDFLYIKDLKDISLTPIIIYQPFGSQNSPDYLLIKEGVVLPFEIKFTNKQTKSPTWNSGLPKQHFLYLFGSKKLNDVTFFFGCDLITTSEINKIKEIVEKNRKILKNEGSIVTDKFNIYLRPMYNQNKNMWENPKRQEIERNTINIIEKF